LPAPLPPLLQTRSPSALLVRRFERARDGAGTDAERDFLIELTVPQLRSALAGHDFALEAEPRFRNETLASLAVLADREQVSLYVGWWRGKPLVLLPVSESVHAFVVLLDSEIPFAEGAHVEIEGRQALWLSWNR
jgi:hypothetical protein